MPAEWTPGDSLGVVCSRCGRRALLAPEEVRRALGTGNDLALSRFVCTRCGRRAREARVIKTEAELKRFWNDGRG